MPGIQICPETGIAIPECSCVSCTERQLEQFAPERIRVRRSKRLRHSPITLITSRFGRRPSNSA
jgi:hypothetical protein